MGSIKNTLCALLIAAGLAVSPKPASADVGRKLENLVLQKKEDVGKEKKEYSLSMAMRYSGKQSRGFIVEGSDADRKLWLTVGAYFSDRYFLYEQEVAPESLTNELFGGAVLERVTRKECYLDSQINYTLYRYTLNPRWKRGMQLEFDFRVGAGLGIYLNANERTYSYKAITGNDIGIQSPIPELDVDAAMVFSASPIVKIGPGTVRYLFEVDTKGRMGHIVGFGVRF